MAPSSSYCYCYCYCYCYYYYLLHLSLLLLLRPSHAQQGYVANKQLDCYNTNASTTLGYSCYGTRPSCNSYLIFRSQTNYQTPAAIASLFNANSSSIAEINGAAAAVSPIPINDLVIVPVNCSCSGEYYQHTAHYTLKDKSETYLIVANNTYQGLTTCQALIDQNPRYDSRSLRSGLVLSVPLRCACPSRNQTGAGVKYLLSYLIMWDDDVDSIAERFRVDRQSVLDANGLSSEDTIFPFTTLLVPLRIEPTKAETESPSRPEPSPARPTAPVGGEGSSNKKWVFVGVGIGVGFLVLCCGSLLFWFLCWRRRRSSPAEEGKRKKFENSVDFGGLSGKPTTTGSSFSVEIRTVLESLTVYKFEELEKATESFHEDRRIKGSVYRGAINGDAAAVKRLKGDVSGEINILKQINHSNVIRLSGFCLHGGDTYLVYEFAEKGSLSDWIHHWPEKNRNSPSSSFLDWKQRVRIAYDVAGGLNYLHNYTNPPYIHKDLKSSNILLDSGLRAKVGNFGLARSVENGDGLQLTRHVVGTQGYMAPEYLEHGLVTPKLDVFAFGVVLLELLSGREAVYAKEGGEKAESLLSGSIEGVLGGENVRDSLKALVDPCLRDEYPFDLVFAVAQLAAKCVAYDLSSRPTMAEVFESLSAIYSSSLDWDPSDTPLDSDSMVRGR